MIGYLIAEPFRAQSKNIASEGGRRIDLKIECDLYPCAERLGRSSFKIYARLKGISHSGIRAKISSFESERKGHAGESASWREAKMATRLRDYW